VEGQGRHAHTVAAAAAAGHGGRVGGVAAPAQEDWTGARPPATLRVVALHVLVVGPAVLSLQRRLTLGAVGAPHLPVRVRALDAGGWREPAAAPDVAAVA
jgi:hypothetical protein